MDILELAANLINVFIIAYMTGLALGGRTLDTLMLMMIGFLCAPYSTIGGLKIPFAYLASVALLVCVLLHGRYLKVPRHPFVLLLSTIIYSQFFVRCLSTVISVFAYAPVSILWPTFLGRLRSILIYGLSIMLAYDGLRNQPIPGGSKLTSNILSAVGISMALNLIAVGVQFYYPEWGLRLVSTWYSSESRYTIQFIERAGSFSRLYGLTYSSVILGINSLVSFAGALFYTLAPLNAIDNRRARIVVLLAVANGIFSLTKTFVIGFVICLLAYFLCRVLKSPQRSPQARTNLANRLLVVCVIILAVAIVANADQLEEATGLLFRYYVSRTIRSPLKAFETRYKYEMVSPGYQLTYDIVKAYPLLGVGMTSMAGEFLGDSEYLVAMHDGGIVVLLLTLMELGLVMWVSWSKRRYVFLGVWFAIALTSFATGVLSTDFCLCLLGIFAGYIAYYESAMSVKS